MKKRIIFTLTTGRSGTALLAKLLKPLLQVHADHEPKPLFSDALVYLKTRPDFDIHEFCKMKLKAIQQSMDDKDIYIETCHSFGKGFIGPMREICSDIEIIILHRNPIDVTMSMYRLGDIPGRTKTGLHWYLSPKDNMSFTTLKYSIQEAYTDFQLCYWYTQEMLCRMNEALEHHQVLCSIEFRELLSYTYFRNVLNQMGITKIPRNYKKYYQSVVAYKVNEKSHRKHPLLLPPDLKEQIDQIHHDLIIK